MIEIQRDYLLLLSDKPCEIFEFFNVDELHGLNKKDCLNHTNNRKQAYIAGWCNLIPNSDKYFVFINLSRCNGLILTTGLVFHELMHYSLAHHNYNMELEEEIITYAETETYDVVKLIYQFI